MGRIGEYVRAYGVRDFGAAGASGAYRYRRARGRFWFENLRSLIILTAIPPALMLVAWLLGLQGIGLYCLVFGAGFAAGLAFLAWMRIPRQAENLREGAEGEVLTARQLDTLSTSGWRPVHDRALDRCNVDHILVGPGGVFVIETKNWKGTIKVGTRGATQDGVVRDRVAPSCRSAATQIKQRIDRAAGIKSGWVNGVVVFWGDFEQQQVEHESVNYLSGGQLVEWLRSRPAKLNGLEIDELAGIIGGMRPGVELSLAG